MVHPAVMRAAELRHREACATSFYFLDASKLRACSHDWPLSKALIAAL